MKYYETLLGFTNYDSFYEKVFPYDFMLLFKE